MKQAVISREHYRALSPKDAELRLEYVNQNPANYYRTGYESYLNFIPIIYGNGDPKKQSKLKQIENVISDLAVRLRCESWIVDNWPPEGAMLNRVILGIDDVTGAELVMVRWNEGATPIHGHAYGQMIDYLVTGRAGEIDYEITDEEKRLVKPVGEMKTFESLSVLSNNFNAPNSSVSRGALVHKFIALSNCITLHVIPEHPRDGRGNLFNEPKTDNA